MTDDSQSGSAAPETEAAPETPPKSADDPTPSFGWSRYAERINGRFAMVGFVALLLLELVTGQTFWAWLGLR
jgi:hypothetical protein